MMRSRKESDELYELKGRDPHSWLDHAESLFYAAEILRDRMFSDLEVPPYARRVETLGLYRGIMLLLGSSMEILIKALDIAHHPVPLKGKLNKAGWKKDGGHNVRDLARNVTTLDTDEESLLERLQEHVVWASRYPIPKDADRLYSSESSNMHSFYERDFQIARGLLDRLSAEISSIPRQTLPS